MRIQQELQSRCGALDLSEIASEMGYSNSKKGVVRIERVLQDQYLGLCDGGWDHVLSSEGFLLRLFDVVGLDLESEGLQNEFEKIKAIAHDESFGFRPWIFVETNFKRRQQPIHQLAMMESRRRIGLDQSIKWLPKKQQIIDELRKIVREHYRTLVKVADGKRSIELWGVVDYYVCHLGREWVIRMSPSGSVLDELGHDIRHGSACMSLP